jgi:hypothetical protein
MKKIRLFVQCGNWSLYLHYNPKDFSTKNQMYIEAATNALEIIFGDKDFTNIDDDYYALMNDDGNNVLDTDDALPIPTFTTKIHILSSKNNEPQKLLTSLRTSDIFANAAQPEHYQIALEAEEIEKQDNK